MLAWGLYRRSNEVTLAALVAFVIVGLGGILAFVTGDVGESSVQDAATKVLIHAHRDAAIAALVGLEAAAGVAVCALFIWKTTHRYPLFAAVATLLLGIAASVLVVRAASLGGPISHIELRAGPVAGK
jgi:uncharacterized membrane protein